MKGRQLNYRSQIDEYKLLNATTHKQVAQASKVELKTEQYLQLPSHSPATNLDSHEQSHHPIDKPDEQH